MDIEAFLRAAKYTLVKYTDMNNEMKEEAMDICVTAVEKYPVDIEKCTQVRPPAGPMGHGRPHTHELGPSASNPLSPPPTDDQGPNGQEVWCTVACSGRERVLIRDHNRGVCAWSGQQHGKGKWQQLTTCGRPRKQVLGAGPEGKICCTACSLLGSFWLHMDESCKISSRFLRW
jgi:hypothetical protein